MLSCPTSEKSALASLANSRLAYGMLCLQSYVVQPVATQNKHVVSGCKAETRNLHFVAAGLDGRRVQLVNHKAWQRALFPDILSYWRPTACIALHLQQNSRVHSDPDCSDVCARPC